MGSFRHDLLGSVMCHVIHDRITISFHITLLFLVSYQPKESPDNDLLRFAYMPCDSCYQEDITSFSNAGFRPASANFETFCVNQ